MSSTSGLGQAVATYSQAQGVSSEIETYDSQITGLNSQLGSIQQLVTDVLSQMQDAPGPYTGDPKDTAAVAAYQQQMQTWQTVTLPNLQREVTDLNQQSQKVAEQIKQLQQKVNDLQNMDLPIAQRNDADREAQQLKDMQDTYESMSNSVSSGDESDAVTAAKADVRRQQMRVDGPSADDDTTATATAGTPANDNGLSLNVQWRSSSVSLDPSNPSLKTLVRAFQVTLGMTGDSSDTARRANPAVAMPDTPGTGLPPVGTP